MTEEIEMKKRDPSKVAHDLHDALADLAKIQGEVEKLQKELSESVTERSVASFSAWENSTLVGYTVIVTPMSGLLEYIKAAK